MTEQFQPIQELLDRVRARWRRRVVLGVAARAALGMSAVVALALVASLFTARAPLALALVAALALVGCLASVVWAVWPARRVPSDRRIARYIEEREPSLDERLVSAVDVATGRAGQSRPVFAESMVRDAARAVGSVDPAAVIPPEVLRGAWLRAGAAGLVLLALVFFARHTARQSYDALALLLFPSHVTLDVTPGNARVLAGTALTIDARLVGNSAPVVAQLLRAPEGGDEWQPTEMESDGDGRFRLSLTGLTTSFRYKVLAGAVSSAAFDVSVVRAPRVARIDVEYAYPKALALPPRVEEDGGDIYAPAGTDVRVLVHTDTPVATGRMVLGADRTLDLTLESPTLLAGALQITENGSYRVALADPEGLGSQGETEYFIRILDDRPPEVHIVRPASDRRVTRLEEIEIAAEAQDDFGISALELVYSVKGGPEQVIPLGIPPRSTAATGRYLMYLEDLDVAPGDLVTYYARARDLARGKKASESRSDIFFLEVKPFEEEFTLAQTQAAMGGGSGNPQLDDLVAAQKEIIVATWKLDRRSRDAQGAKSEQDIKAVAKAQDDLRVRVEQTASSFRTSALRDPRRSRPTQPRPGGGPPRPPSPPAPGAPRVGQTMSEEDAMTTASAAMGKAVTSLNGLKTTDAIPHEVDALNALLKAQSDVTKRQIQQQQAGNSGGRNRSTEDLSSLFDKELARNQQTNYEQRTTTEQNDESKTSAADRIKDLAQRQDELVRRQQELARNRNQMSAEEARRQLERLSRDQNDLRERAEEVARQLAQQQSGQQGQQNQGGQQGQQSPGGQQAQGGQQQGQQSGQQAGQQGQPGQSGQRRPGAGQNARAGTQGPEGSRELREISEEMRGAASELRREDAAQASARGARALDKLRELERQLQGNTPEGRRRALGDLQLEARQLADAQRQIAGESGRAQRSDQNGDTLRRLAGEQDRLAERLERVQEGLQQQGAPGQQAAGAAEAGGGLQQAASEAAREIEQQRLSARMQQSADAMRRAADGSQAAGGNGSPSGAPAPSQAAAQEELARALDRLADRLNASATPQDDESRRMSDQVARARELRDRLDELDRRLEALDRQAASEPGTPGRSGSRASSAAGQRGQPGQGQDGSGGDAAEFDRLRAELARQMQEVRQLLGETERDANARMPGGPGSTLEGQGMVLSAPGTEGFKQDFAKWQELKRQVTLALDDVESSVARRLQDKAAKDRLASGVDEKVPAEYQQQVDSYFKSLATRKRP